MCSPRLNILPLPFDSHTALTMSSNGEAPVTLTTGEILQQPAKDPYVWTTVAITCAS